MEGPKEDLSCQAHKVKILAGEQAECSSEIRGNSLFGMKRWVGLTFTPMVRMNADYLQYFAFAHSYVYYLLLPHQTIIKQSERQ